MTDHPAVPSSPAGWYPDPAGGVQRRWWDGARWTDTLETPYSTATAGQLDRAPEGTDPYTIWIWLILAIPVLQLLSLALIDWPQFIAESLADPTSTGQLAVFSMPGYLAVTALGWIGNALIILFAFFDWRELRQRGVPQPFHWAWAFVVLAATSAVYVIGRSVVVRRRTGRGMAPMWIAIGTIVLSIVVAMAFTAYIFQIVVESLPAGSFAP